MGTLRKYCEPGECATPQINPVGKHLHLSVITLASIDGVQDYSFLDTGANNGRTTGQAISNLTAADCAQEGIEPRKLKGRDKPILVFDAAPIHRLDLTETLEAWGWD